MAVVQEPQPPAKARQAQQRQRLLSLLAAFLFFLGLTVLTGFGIAWVRLETIGMSPGDTVSALGPRHILEVGAYQLAVFALAGALAVGGCWLIARRGTPLGHQVTGTWLAVAGLAVAVLTFRASDTARLVSLLLLAAGGACLTVIALTTGSRRVHHWLHRHGWLAVAAATGFVVAEIAALWNAYEKVAAGALAVVAVLAGTLILLAVASTTAPETQFLKRLVELADRARKVLTVVSFALVAGVLFLLMGTWAIVGLMVFAGLLGLRLRHAPDEGRPFRRHAVEVFLAVVGFGMALVVLHTAVQPGARPFAFLDADGNEIVGIYVGSTGGSKLVAVGPHCWRDKNLQLQPGRLKRDRATLLAVGGVGVHVGGDTPLAQVFDKAAQQLNDLRERAGLAPHPPAAQCEDEGPVDLTVRADAPVSRPLARELALAYRPILLFDSEERWRPLNVERLMQERIDGSPIHTRCSVNAECTPISDISDLAATDASTIDLAGQELGGSDYAAPDLAACPLPQPANLRDCDDGPASAIYYSVRRANGRVYIDYWWFLRYNHFARYSAPELCRNRSLRVLGSLSCLEHEADWEGVTVVTAVGDPQRLEYVDFAAHEGVYRRPVARLELVGRRPRVYVAQGSHAAYPVACPEECPQVAQVVFDLHVPEANTDGSAGWARNSDTSCNRPPRCLLPLPAADWNAFPGHWGSQACVSGRSSCRLAVPPQSPSAQRRYRVPWCYTDEQSGGLRCDPGDIDRRPS
jgi:hypothetical protein